MEVQMEQIADILSLDPVLFLSNQKAEALIWQSFSLKGLIDYKGSSCTVDFFPRVNFLIGICW